MALSDAAIRRAKTTGKPYTLPDALGLSLAVAATGGQELALPLLLAQGAEVTCPGNFEPLVT